MNGYEKDFEMKNLGNLSECSIGKVGQRTKVEKKCGRGKYWAFCERRQANGRWRCISYKASRNSEGIKAVPQGGNGMLVMVGLVEKFIGDYDLKIRKMRRYGSASEKSRKASCTSAVTRSDWEASEDMQGELNVWYHKPAR